MTTLKKLRRLVAIGGLFASAALAGENPLSTVFYTGAPWTQEQPQAASDGTNFLVAWRDNRAQTPPETIYAARVASDGRLLDRPTAIRIPDPYDTPTTAWTNAPPVVAWTGGMYIVAWQDWGSRSMRIVRVDREGQVLDARPRTIANVGNIMYGAGASTGNRALIVYLGSDSSLHAVLFDADGRIIAPNVLLPLGGSPAVASNGESFYVTWARWDGSQNLLMGARLASDGTSADARVIATTLTGPMIASNGNDYLITYIDAQKRLAIEHLDRNGASVSRRILPMSVSWPFVGNLIARYGSGYVLAAVDPQRRVTGVLLDRDGEKVGEISLTTSGSTEGAIAFAANANATLIAWPETRSGGTVDRDIFSRIIGSQANDTLLSPAAARQRYPRIASSPTGYLAVWLEYRGPDDGELRATRLSVGGAPIDGEGFKLGAHVYDPPAVTFDGRNFVVAWLDRSSGTAAILINRITTDGALLDGPSGRVAVTGYQYSFGLGSNGRESLLAWTGYTNSSTYLRAAHIARDGSTDSLVELPANEHAATELAVGSAGDTWLVAWSELVPVPWCSLCPSPPPPPKYNVLAARLNSAFNLLDGMPLTIAADPAIDERHVSVGSNGTDFLLAWDESTGSPMTIHARAVAASSGVMGESMGIATGALPSVAWLGNDYAIAWQNLRDLFYARLKSRAAIPLAASPDDESNVAMLGAVDNTFIAAYERTATEKTLGAVSRAFVRLEAPTNRTRRVHH